MSVTHSAPEGCSYPELVTWLKSISATYLAAQGDEWVWFDKRTYNLLQTSRDHREWCTHNEKSFLYASSLWDIAKEIEANIPNLVARELTS